MTQKEFISSAFDTILETFEETKIQIKENEQLIKLIDANIKLTTEAKLEFFKYSNAADYLHSLIESVQKKNSEMREAIKEMVEKARQKVETDIG